MSGSLFHKKNSAMMPCKTDPLIGFLFAAAVLLPCFLPAQSTQDTVVLVEVSVSDSPPSIELLWPAGAATTVSRKGLAAAAWTVLTNNLPGTAAGYTDTNVTVGSAYEYRVNTITGTGYVYAGIQAPLIENRGSLILLVDTAYSLPLSNELVRLKRDLIGDGWNVIRHDVSSGQSVASVKSLIQADYNADPDGVQAVFLFGHVPQPYSGNLAPDGHSNHFGAWPADVYYGEMNGVWTDTTVNNTNAVVRQRNVPGDGKFDQSTLPSPVELQVGRVDLFNMPAFPMVTNERMRRYLDKDHKFRNRMFTVQERGLIDDNFGYFNGEAFAATGWRAFSSFFGAAAVHTNDFFTTLRTNTYLCSYGCGSGNPTGAAGVGTTADFAANEVHSVFTFLFGSGFGDWDTENNFLRAPLGSSPWALTCAWAGRPHWYVHHMALGLPIGYSTRATQNNTGLYRSSSYAGYVHIGLMGDPSLRLHPVAPPSQITTVTNLSGDVTLNWIASAEPVAGYHIYRAPAFDGPYTRLSPSLETGTAFTDENPLAATNFYMVRAVKLQTSASGTYYNPSQGTFGASPDRQVTLTVNSAFGSPHPSTGTYSYSWYDAAAITCSVSGNVIEITGDTRLVVSGWSGTGDASAGGTGSVTPLINLKRDSSITWQWQTNFLISIATDGKGTVDKPSGWYPADTNITLTAVANAFYIFSHWSGTAVPEGMEQTNPLQVSFAAAGEITASFMPDQNPDNTLPFAESFETYSPGTQLPGTSGWDAGASSDATVSTNSEVISGIVDYGLTQSYPINTTHQQAGVLTNDVSLRIVSASNTIVITKLLAKMQPYPTARTPDPSALTDQLAVIFSEEGYLRLFHGTPGAGANVWSTFTGTPYDLNKWHTITLEKDYATVGQGSRYFRISIDNGPWLTHTAGYTANDGSGSPGGVWFAIANTNSARLTSLEFCGNPFLVDDILIGEAWSAQGGSGDLDQDGMWDLWEFRYFGGMNAPGGSATDDRDGDGVDNRSEYIAGTDPGDANSVLIIREIVHTPGGVRISWQGGHDVRQYLERSDDLKSGVWQTIFTNPPPTDSLNEQVDTNAAALKNFYRIRVNRE